MKISRVLIFRILRIDLDPQKLVPAEKKTPQNKTPQKLTPFSQIKNYPFNGLVVYGRDRYGGPQRQYTNMYYITAFYILVHKHIHWPCEYIYQYNKIYVVVNFLSQVIFVFLLFQLH